MFNPLYVEHVKKNIPLLNPLIANGLAQEHAKSAMQHIDDIFKEMAKGFPPYITYDGIERATPEEEYSVTTKSKSSSRRYDLARTDSYFCKYKITVGGQAIVRYMALPIIGAYRDWETDRKSTRLNCSHSAKSRMPSSA